MGANHNAVKLKNRIYLGLFFERARSYRGNAPDPIPYEKPGVHH